MFQALGTFLPRSAGLRLAVAFAAIIILAGSLFLYLDGQRLRAAVQAEAERHGTFLFSTISHQFSDSLYFDDIEQIRKDAESLALREEITRIAVFTTEGKYLLDSDQFKVPGGNIDDDLLDLVMTHREPLSRLVGDKLQFIGGVETDNRLLGGLYFELDLTERLKVAVDSIRDRSLLGLVIVILSSGLAFAIAAASGTARSLRTIESNYKELIEQSPLPNAVFTTDGKLRYANPAFVKLMDRSSHSSWLKYDIFTDPSLNCFESISAYP
jgi:PAS domain-containing protein